MGTDAEGLDALAARCRDGDAHALEQVLGRVRPAVVRFVLAQGLPAQDVEDVAQEVCVALTRSLATWEQRREGEGPVWSFVFTVVRRRLVDRHRSSGRRTEVGEEELATVLDPAPGPEELAVHADGLGELRRHLDRLPATQREVLLLRVVVGLDVAETAQALGLARGSVHVIQHRALSALRARYAAHEQRREATA